MRVLRTFNGLKNNNRNRCLLIATCLFFLLFTQATYSYGELAAPPPEEIKLNILESTDNNTVINIFFDGSLSMKGYVVSERFTSYKTLVNNLESIITARWPKSILNIYKFGSKVFKLKERNDVLMAVNSAFYEEKGISFKTYIDKVFDENGVCDNNTMSVVITDLFQSDGDINRVLKKINEKCMEKSVAVGVIGIKSEFKGVVTDIGLYEKGLPYSSKRDSKDTYRPFYLLIFGPYNNVLDFFDSLSEKLPAVSTDMYEFKDKMTIFYSHMVNPLISFEGSKFESLNKTARETSGLINNKTYQKEIVKQYRVLNEAGAGVRLSLKTHPLKYIPAFCESKIKATYKIEKFFNGQFITKDDFFNISSGTEDNNTIFIEVKIKKKIWDGGLFRISVTLNAEKEALNNNENWWNDWNLKLDDLDKWRKFQFLFPGYKTVNLNTFMSSLSDMTIQKSDLKLGQLYFYLMID
ncbi:MAG: hypothetical protein HQK92_02390 [Nitrospirae bacterium]|nr:hypothetical protein [Nitrospirota bacterium]